MDLNPDYTQAFWELGSACFQLPNVFAIRKSKSISGIHWYATAFFTAWGIYNLWFYTALNLPTAYWAGLAITAVNLLWLGHLCYYAWRRGKSK